MRFPCLQGSEAKQAQRYKLGVYCRTIRKIPAPITIKLAPPPPQKNPNYPSSTRLFVGMEVFLQKERPKFQAPVKVAQPFPAPALGAFCGHEVFSVVQLGVVLQHYLDMKGSLKGSLKGLWRGLEGSSYLSAEEPFKTPSRTLRKPLQEGVEIDDALGFPEEPFENLSELKKSGSGSGGPVAGNESLDLRAIAGNKSRVRFFGSVFGFSYQYCFYRCWAQTRPLPLASAITKVIHNEALLP